MKNVLLKLSAVMLLVVCFLSSCEDTPPAEVPIKEPFVYNDFEVVFAGTVDYGSDEQIVEDGIESIVTTIGARKVTLFYQYTDAIQRVYKFERDTVAITVGISKSTEKVSLFEITGAIAEVFSDYDVTLEALDTEDDYLSLINHYATLLEIENFDKYEHSCSTCYTSSWSPFYKEEGFEPLPLEEKPFSHYEFNFKRPPVDGIPVDGATAFEIGPNRLCVSICQNPIDSELINVDKASVIEAVKAFLASNFSSDYSITDINVSGSGMYIQYVNGRLCCVNIEAVVKYIPKEDDYFNHKHCFLCVFLKQNQRVTAIDGCDPFFKFFIKSVDFKVGLWYYTIQWNMSI